MTKFLSLSKMFYLFYLSGIFFLLNSGVSVPLDSEEDENSTTQSGNETAQNLYVIRSVVYEIGILTDADDDPDLQNETHEQVDVSFFDPGHNGSIIDLSNIPIPIQTNISGVSVTGILPTDLGRINLNENGTASFNGTSFPIFPNKQIKITHNISTLDKDKSASILTGLPKILGLDEILKTDSNNQQIDSEDGDELDVDPLDREIESR